MSQDSTPKDHGKTAATQVLVHASARGCLPFSHIGRSSLGCKVNIFCSLSFFLSYALSNARLRFRHDFQLARKVVMAWPCAWMLDRGDVVAAYLIEAHLQGSPITQTCTHCTLVMLQGGMEVSHIKRRFGSLSDNLSNIPLIMHGTCIFLSANLNRDFVM
jgi:hypothetical protein